MVGKKGKATSSEAKAATSSMTFGDTCSKTCSVMGFKAQQHGQPRSNTRRLRDNRHAGLCGVAMAFDHVMILQLV
jgi:hypothetical protein